MKKFASVLLAVLVVFSMFSFVVSAAGTNITASANKTADLKVGDKVKVTVSLSSDKGLGTLDVTLGYDAAVFKLVKVDAGTAFGSAVINDKTAGSVKYVAASAAPVNEGSLFVAEFEVVNAADSAMSLKVDEATDDNYENVNVTTSAASFKGFVEAPSEKPSETPSEKPSETPSEKPSETPSEKPSETPSEKPSEPEDPCKDGHDYSKELVVKKPTCKEAGVAQKTCKVCGDKVEFAIEATGKCEPGAWKVVKAATTTAEGEKVQECKYCGAVLQRAKIAKLSSDPITTPAIPNTDAQA